MQNKDQNLSADLIKLAAVTDTFLIATFLYLWLFIDLKMIYHGGGWIDNFPIFYKTGDYFAKFLTYPGGLAEYSAAFLAQLFKFSWLGSIVVTTQLALIILCTAFILKKIKLANIAFLSFAPPLLIIATYARYTYYFTITFAYLISLICTCLYLLTAGKKQTQKLITFLLLSIICYYISGGSYLLFALTCIIYELLHRRNIQSASLYLLIAAALPYLVGSMLLNRPITDSYFNMTALHFNYLCDTDTGKMSQTIFAVYAIIPLIMILPKAYEFLKRQKLQEKTKLQITFRQIFVIIIISAGTFYLNTEPERKALFEANYYESHEKWPQVLSTTKKHSNSFFTITAATHALYHTGQLAENEFSIPQSPEILFLTNPQLMPAHWSRFNIFLNLGLLNLAEHELACSIEKFGERPYLLKQMALVNMAKGDINTAKVYLGSLKTTLFDSKWAKDYLSKINEDPQLPYDSKIQFYKSIMMQENYGFDAFKSDYVLKSLLKTNPKNKMAFEYLMAYYLLNKNLKGFVENLDYIKNFNYQKMPKTYEQALIVYITGNKTAKINYPISSTAQNDFIKLNQILNSHNGNKNLAYQELAEKFGNNYTFYYLYSRSGMKQ